MCHEALGEINKAIEVINAKGIVVNQIVKHERLASLYRKLGDKDKAIEHLE